MRYNFTPTRGAIIKKTTKSELEVKKLESFHIAGGNESVFSLENSLSVSLNVKTFTVCFGLNVFPHKKQFLC